MKAEDELVEQVALRCFGGWLPECLSAAQIAWAVMEILVPQERYWMQAREQYASLIIPAIQNRLDAQIAGGASVQFRN